MTCPHCDAAMNEVRAEASTGYFIVLDQCPACGGLWCDRFELFPITAAAAARLDRVDPDALLKPVAAIGEPLTCPRCRARMRLFRDPVLPPDARIERCPNCEGLWLNRGELWRVKQHAGPAQHAVAPGAPAQLDRLTQAVSRAPAHWPTIANLDSAFDAPPLAERPDDLRHDLAREVLWLVVRAALRLLLHW